MTPKPGRMPSGTSPVVAVALAVTAVLLVVGGLAITLGVRAGTSTPVPPPPAAAPAATPAAPATSSGAPSAGPSATASQMPTAQPHAVGEFLDASQPTSIEIPSIGVRSTTFVPLTVQGDGTISVPGTAREVGLYAGGPTPGQLGPSVVAAHVDTPSGVPGIFHDLGRVKPGDVVKVARHDGSHLTFMVDRVAAYRKAQFPTELVYKGDFTQAEIRLVTCGGPTDERNEYRDNVIVFGHLTKVS